MMVTFEVLASAALVAAVLWAMWQTPVRGQSLLGWAPPLALLSAWAGLAGVAVSGLLWLLTTPDWWLVLVFLVLDPASLAAGTLVLWLYRGQVEPSETVAMQRVQAKVGIVLGLVAVTIGYVYVMTHKAPFTPVGR